LAGAMDGLILLNECYINLVEPVWRSGVSAGRDNREDVESHLMQLRDSVIPAALLRNILYDACLQHGKTPCSLSIHDEAALSSKKPRTVGTALDNKWSSYRFAFSVSDEIALVVGEWRYNLYRLHCEKFSRYWRYTYGRPRWSGDPVTNHKRESLPAGVPVTQRPGEPLCKSAGTVAGTTNGSIHLQPKACSPHGAN
jgi:hypothetical protein